MKAVLITTIHRGVFFGRVAPDADLTTTTLRDIHDARMAIRFSADRGVMALAETGPTSKAKIGAPATITVLHDVTAVFEVSEEAEKRWMSS